jgi:hypothetical protein
MVCAQLMLPVFALLVARYDVCFVRHA